MGIFSKSVVGLELDSGEIRAIELSGSTRKPVLEAFGRIPLPEGAVKDGKVADAGAVKTCLEKLWADNGIKSRNVYLGVGNQEVLVRFAPFPKVPRDKLANLVKFQAREYIPVPMDEMELDFMVTGEITNEEGTFHKVLLVAARKKMLHDFLNTLEDARLKPQDIDSSLLALGRIAPEKERSETVALVGITCDMLNLLILNGGMPAMARSVAFNPSVSSLLKSFYSPTGIDSARDAEEALREASDSIVGEIRSSVDYFQMNSSTGPVRSIRIAGGCGKIRGLGTQVKNGISIPVFIAEPFEDMLSKSGTGRSGSFDRTDYAVCASLALRGLEG